MVSFICIERRFCNHAQNKLARFNMRSQTVLYPSVGIRDAFNECTC